MKKLFKDSIKAILIPFTALVFAVLLALAVMVINIIMKVFSGLLIPVILTSIIWHIIAVKIALMDKPFPEEGRISSINYFTNTINIILPIHLKRLSLRIETLSAIKFNSNLTGKLLDVYSLVIPSKIKTICINKE